MMDGHCVPNEQRRLMDMIEMGRANNEIDEICTGVPS
jgi:hypothetical protein